MNKAIEFVRAFVRPWIAYIFSGSFVGLAIYAFVKYGSADIAQTIIAGFVGITGTVIGFYFMQRAVKK